MVSILKYRGARGIGIQTMTDDRIVHNYTIIPRQNEAMQLLSFFFNIICSFSSN